MPANQTRTDQNNAGKRARRPLWLLLLLGVTPLQLGAKGCDTGVVGSDRPVCGGLQGNACAAGQFCEFPPDASCGAADATGVCKPIPEACTLEYAPVCGCDDRTYGNACEASRAGVSVAQSGECDGGGGEDGICGGLAGLGCAEGEFCNYPADALCGAADATGVCTAIPVSCTFEYAPVCGCDDRTYATACAANAAGVSVARSGECEPDGNDGACGGLMGLTCAAGEFCNYAPDALCGAADATGTCAPVPQACDTIHAPVCGCDGMTYSSACTANGAGVSVASAGECGAPGGATSCGGFVGAACPAGEYCNYAGSDLLCGEADGTGVCAPMPTGCTRESDPVCGCDGATYGNPCMAAAAGISVRAPGECPPAP